MKRIALLLVFIMILGCCFALSSCGNNGEDSSSSAKTPEEDSSSSAKTPEEEAEDAVKFRMMAELKSLYLGGSTITFESCTYGTTKNLGSDQYRVSGTVKIRDQYGNFHVANYDAEVEYDADYDYWDAEIYYGTFEKQ